MKQKILITSALPYANGPLHFGHIAGAYLPADCYARFQRLMGNDVLYIGGSDEYGIAITLSAEMAGRTPQQHVDIFHAINKDFFKQLDISFDNYSRTTWPGHVKPTQQYFSDLLNNGYIEERITDQLYSDADGKFLADRYVVGTCPKCRYNEARGDECQKCGAAYEATDLIEPRSKLTGSKLTLKPTKHWYLLLDKFKDQLNEWLSKKNWKPNVINFVKSYVDELRPRAITRDMTWGIPIPLPGTEGKVLYVWFDAPIGYISSTMEWAEKKGNPDLWKSYWQDPQTKLVNFIGKDNIPFHGVIFPAMTMGQNQPYKLVDELPANEFYNLEGRQFSKSEGWTIDLERFFQTYTTDQIRYVIAANAPETSDSEFTWKDFQLRCNGELSGKYGNLVNRVMVFAKNNCGQKVPPKHNLADIDKEFLAQIKELASQIQESYETFRVRRASKLLMDLAQLGNVYFDAKKPWSEAKNPDTRGSMETTIACCLECIKVMALAAFPIIPATAEKVWKMLGYQQPLERLTWTGILDATIPENQGLGESQILFKRVEDEQIQAEIDILQKLSQQKKSVEAKPMIDIDQFKQMDLRVGAIVEAVAVPKSNKLLQLRVDLGTETRTIVAGISGSYEPDQLIGKKVIVVANLKPAKLMGIESHGMLLAAHGGDKLELVSVTEPAPGSTVK
jgi:methionyl-tRNA synthetase